MKKGNKMIAILIVLAIAFGLGYYLTAPKSDPNANPNLLNPKVTEEGDELQGSVLSSEDIKKYDGDRHGYVAGNECFESAKSNLTSDKYDFSKIIVKQDSSNYIAEFDKALNDPATSKDIKEWWESVRAKPTDKLGEIKNKVIACSKELDSDDFSDTITQCCSPIFEESGVRKPNGYPSMDLLCKVQFVGTYFLRPVAKDMIGAFGGNELGHEFDYKNDAHVFYPYQDDEDPYFWYCYLKNDDTFFAKLLKEETITPKLKSGATETGQCGSDDGKTLSSEPTNLCIIGTAYKPNGEPGVHKNQKNWLWECRAGDQDPGVSCSANADEDNLFVSEVNGQCGSDDGKTLSSKPTDLCEEGTPTELLGVDDGSGKFVWTCEGANGGSNEECSATIKTDKDVKEDCSENGENVGGITANGPLNPSKCCDPNAEIKPNKYITPEGDCALPDGGATGTCLLDWGEHCGDGVCNESKDENYCTCPEDCEKPRKIEEPEEPEEPEDTCGSSHKAKNVEMKPSANLCNKTPDSQVYVFDNNDRWEWSCGNNDCYAFKPQPGVISFEKTEYEVAEGGQTQLSVTRSEGSDGAVEIEVKSASNIGEGYHAGFGKTLKWADGESQTQTVNYLSVSNEKKDGDKVDAINLKLKAGKAAIATPTATVTIKDDDGGGTTGENAACGSANGIQATAAPSSAAELCSVGTPSEVVGSNPWAWTCTEGSTVDCSTKAPVVTDENQKPEACFTVHYHGFDNVMEWNKITLDASCSIDPDGDDLTYKWLVYAAGINPEKQRRVDDCEDFLYGDWPMEKAYCKFLMADPGSGSTGHELFDAMVEGKEKVTFEFPLDATWANDYNRDYNSKAVETFIIAYLRISDGELYGNAEYSRNGYWDANEKIYGKRINFKNVPNIDFSCSPKEVSIGDTVTCRINKIGKNIDKNIEFGYNRRYLEKISENSFKVIKVPEKGTTDIVVKPYRNGKELSWINGIYYGTENTFALTVKGQNPTVTVSGPDSVLAGGDRTSNDKYTWTASTSNGIKEKYYWKIYCNDSEGKVIGVSGYDDKFETTGFACPGGVTGKITAKGVSTDQIGETNVEIECNPQIAHFCESGDGGRQLCLDSGQVWYKNECHQVDVDIYPSTNVDFGEVELNTPVEKRIEINNHIYENVEFTNASLLIDNTEYSFADVGTQLRFEAEDPAVCQNIGMNDTCRIDIKYLPTDIHDADINLKLLFKGTSAGEAPVDINKTLNISVKSKGGVVSAKMTPDIIQFAPTPIGKTNIADVVVKNTGTENISFIIKKFSILNDGKWQTLDIEDEATVNAISKELHYEQLSSDCNMPGGECKVRFVFHPTMNAILNYLEGQNTLQLNYEIIGQASGTVKQGVTQIQLNPALPTLEVLTDKHKYVNRNTTPGISIDNKYIGYSEGSVKIGEASVGVIQIKNNGAEPIYLQEKNKTVQLADGGSINAKHMFELAQIRYKTQGGKWKMATPAEISGFENSIIHNRSQYNENEDILMINDGDCKVISPGQTCDVEVGALFPENFKLEGKDNFTVEFIFSAAALQGDKSGYTGLVLKMNVSKDNSGGDSNDLQASILANDTQDWMLFGGAALVILLAGAYYFTRKSKKAKK